MPESDNRVKVTLEELMVSTLAMTDALSKLLIEKGVITEFKKKARRGTSRVSEDSQVDCLMTWRRRTVAYGQPQ